MEIVNMHAPDITQSQEARFAVQCLLLRAPAVNKGTAAKTPALRDQVDAQRSLGLPFLLALHRQQKL